MKIKVNDIDLRKNADSDGDGHQKGSLVKEGLSRLSGFCGNSEKTWDRLQHVAELRFLLTVHEGIIAQYPLLDNTKPPGYVQLLEQGYLAKEALTALCANINETPTP